MPQRGQIRASARNRAMKSGSETSAGSRTLTATCAAEEQVGATPDVAHAAGGDTFVQAVATAEHDPR